IADFNTLTSLSSSALLAIYLICCSATLRLRYRRVGDELQPFRLPVGPAIPVLAIVLVVGLMTTLAGREVLALGVFLLLAIGTFLVSRRKAQIAPRAAEPADYRMSVEDIVRESTRPSPGQVGPPAAKICE